jgi:molybdate transport system substrate-binding protein
MTRIIALATLILVFISLPGNSINAQSSGMGNNDTVPRLLVFAAASMKNVLEEIGQKYETQCGCKMAFSFAGSGTLARQIEAGAPADIFISADLRWMDWLEQKNAIKPGLQRMIAGNVLIVAAAAGGQSPKSNTAANEAKRDLAELLKRGRIAMANPDSVPAGRYGKQALKNLGLWHDVSSRLVFGENVRVSLLLAARGNVAAAIVYRSDALIEPRVKIAHSFASGVHDPIAYPASLVKSSVEGEEFLEFLSSRPARLIFRKFGFTAGAND